VQPDSTLGFAVKELAGGSTALAGTGALAVAGKREGEGEQDAGGLPTLAGSGSGGAGAQPQPLLGPASIVEGRRETPAGTAG